MNKNMPQWERAGSFAGLVIETQGPKSRLVNPKTNAVVLEYEHTPDLTKIKLGTPHHDTEFHPIIRRSPPKA